MLKIFRGRSIEQVTQQKLPELSRQWFKVVDNKILLKTSHSYHYQIQLQHLVTKAEYCNFSCIQILEKYTYREYLRIKTFNTELLKLPKYIGEGSLFWSRFFYLWLILTKVMILIYFENGLFLFGVIPNFVKRRGTKSLDEGLWMKSGVCNIMKLTK